MVVLISPFEFRDVRGQVGVDNADLGVVELEADGDAALVAQHPHDPGPDRLGGNLGNVGRVGVLDEHDQHHADEPYEFHLPVFGFRMQGIINNF